MTTTLSSRHPVEGRRTVASKLVASMDFIFYAFNTHIIVAKQGN